MSGYFCAAGFWNSLAFLLAGSVFRHVALEACSAVISHDHRNWAHFTSKATRGIGHRLNIRCADLDHIDISMLSLMLAQCRNAVWDGLDICPKTCPSLNAKSSTFATWFARHAEKHARSLLDLVVSWRCTQRFLHFKMGCHRLPRDVLPCMYGLPVHECFLFLFCLHAASTDSSPFSLQNALPAPLVHKRSWIDCRGLHNGHAKGQRGLPSELLRYANLF